MKIIFLFPGYGSQFVGMSKEIYDNSRLVQELFEQASSCLDINFVKLCFASSDADLAHMSRAYPALFLVCSSICALLKEYEIYPDAVAGFGNGEFAALFAANSLNLPDGLYLLSKLTSFYRLKLDNSLLRAVRIQRLNAKKLIEIMQEFPDDQIFISHYENNESIIVSGVSENFPSFEKKVKAAKGKVKAVSIAYGLHSKMADDVLASFKPYMAKVDIKDLQMPLISNLDGKSLTKGTAMRDRIFKSIVNPVKWPSVTKQLKNYDMIVEIGPSSSYINDIKELLPEKKVLSISKPEDIELIKSVLSECQEKKESNSTLQAA